MKDYQSLTYIVKLVYLIIFITLNVYHSSDASLCASRKRFVRVSDIEDQIGITKADLFFSLNSCFLRGNIRSIRNCVDGCRSNACCIAFAQRKHNCYMCFNNMTTDGIVNTPNRGGFYILSEYLNGLERNLALNKPAYSSSIYYAGFPEQAVDGNFNTFYREHSCSHTVNENDPWWAVDFGNARFVYAASITNRGDNCCGDRLHDFTTYVSSDAASPVVSSNKQQCANFVGAVSTGATIRLECTDTLFGRYFSVLIEGEAETLTLCEVQVWGS